VISDFLVIFEKFVNFFLGKKHKSCVLREKNAKVAFLAKNFTMYKKVILERFWPFWHPLGKTQQIWNSKFSDFIKTLGRLQIGVKTQNRFGQKSTNVQKRGFGSFLGIFVDTVKRLYRI